jgi:hypothetical protein
VRHTGTGNVVFKLAAGFKVNLVGYDSLRFAFHPGSSSGTRLELYLSSGEFNDTSFDLLSGAPGAPHVDLSNPSWQEIAIPLSVRGPPEGQLSQIIFMGKLQGTYYLDDIRLGAAGGSGTLPSAIVEDHTAILPQRITLEQNYPNPFNPSTSIRFALPKAAVVSLKVYDVTGQRVATLLNGEARAAGTYTVPFDASALASGVYFYRLDAGAFHQVRKMLLVK